MDTEKVVQDLNRRFAQPLPEFYQRRIIVWQDEDKEFADVIDDVALENARVVVLTGSNQFSVKKLIAVDDKYSNILLYAPLPFEDKEDNWLLDVKLYSESFHADRLSMWMDELGLDDSAAMRKVFKDYRIFFANKERRGKVAGLKKRPASPKELHLAVMAAICGIKDPEPRAILRAVLKAGLQDDNKILAALRQYNAEEMFWMLARQGTGYDEEGKHLYALANRILLTATSRTMGRVPLSGLESYISTPHVAFCYDFVSTWLHSEDSDAFQDIARAVETNLHLLPRFAGLTIEELLETECYPCINSLILKKLMADIGDRRIDPEAIIQAVDKRRTCVWYDDVRPFFEGILQVAHMQTFYRENGGGFHTVEPAKVWEEYTGTYYKMDTYYRLFHLANERCKKNYHSDLGEAMGKVEEVVEGLYTTWFLGKLGSSWSDVAASQLQEYGYILNVDRQENFYSEWVKPSDTKIFVIISDAMRYEVAATLADELRLETQSQVKLHNCQATFPTITKFGMAALLPHDKLSVEDKGDRLAVLVDGASSEAGVRDKVLKKANPNSAALRYSEIIGKTNRAERRAMVKSMEVVYIYHDTIDTAGHEGDAKVFRACSDAIEEIKNMVRIIVNDFNTYNILITADHGFLYTNSPLTESDKVGKDFSGREKEFGRRYAILEKGASPELLMPIKFLDGNTPYDGFTPRESIRIKMQGGGLNFVHGGISLQEMVVPVIEYRFLRNASKEYQNNQDRYDIKPVTLSLLTANKRLSNLIFSLDFYQKEPVGDNRQACTYLIYFTDSNGRKISDEQRVIADKTGTETRDRAFRFTFNLKSQKYSEYEPYFLVIADEKGLQPPQRIEFEIRIALAIDDFNFF